MPRYRIKLADGRTVIVDAEHQTDAIAAVRRAIENPREPLKDPQEGIPGLPQDLPRGFGGPGQFAAQQFGQDAAGVTPEEFSTFNARAIPGVVGAMGGLLGLSVPATIGAVIAAGAAGETGRQLASDEKLNVAGIAKAGGREAATEIAGAGVGKGLQLAGRGLQRIAMRPSRDVLLETPDVIERSLRVGGVGPTVRGHERALAARRASREQADKLIMDAQGNLVSERPISRIALRDRAQSNLAPRFRQEDTELGTQATEALHNRLSGFMRGSREMSLSDANAAKRLLDQGAERAFDASRAGEVAQDAQARISRELSGGLREQLESHVPGLRERNLETKGLGSVAQMAREGIHSTPVSQMGLGFAGSGLLGLGVGTGNIPSATVGAGMLALTSPPLTSALGRGAFRAGERLPLAQLIRAAITQQALQQQQAPIEQHLLDLGP